MSADFEFPPQLGLLSVIIPTGDDAPGLEITLESLERQTLGRDRFEVLVANDGAHASVSSVCEKFPRVKEIVLPRNRGSYAARNAALARSSGEFIGFVDANIEVPAVWCERAIKKLSEAEYVGGPINFPFPEHPTVPEWVQIMGGLGFTGGYSLKFDHYIVTGNLFVTRSVIERVGFFDDRLLSGGDLEFGDRVYRLGTVRQILLDELGVIHPFRNHEELIRRQRRIAQSRSRLAALFPDRFSHLKPSFPQILRSFAPPRQLSVESYSGRMPGLAEGWVCYLYRWYTKVVFAFWSIHAMMFKTDYIDPPQAIRASTSSAN